MYYPLLKNNNNEIKALKNLKELSQSKVFPIIESKRIKQDSINNWESTFNTLGKYLHERISQISFIYDFNTALDDLNSDKELINSKNENLVSYCIKKFSENNLKFIPCFQHDSPNWIINTIFNYNFNEIAIRIRCHDFKESMDYLIMQNLLKIINTANIKSKFILILDFYNQNVDEIRIKNAINTFGNIPHSKIIYLATSCPEDASKTTAHSINYISPRNELKMYLKLKKLFPNLSFGDYTTRLKGKIINGFNNDNSYIKIFYSSESDYYIVKSKMIKDEGEETFYEVCRELINLDIYPGEDFSYGDKEIKKCADKKIAISGHQTPIAIGINHHIETTIKQLLG